MADTTFYNRGDAYHDSAGNPAIIKRGNELTFTEHFNAGGGTPPTYSTTKTDTGKRWVDGSIIYQRVIEYTGDGLDVDTTGVIAEENTDVQIPMGCWSSDGVNGFALFDGTWVEDDNLKIRGFSNLNGIKYVVIEYI